MLRKLVRLSLAVALLCVASGALRAAEGISDSEVVFVQIAAMNGSAASLGQGMSQGVRAAFDEVNRAGGVEGRKLRLDTIDDGYDPSQSIAALRRVIHANDRLALIGATGTPTLAALQPAATQAGLPVIGPFTGAAFLRNAALGNVFNLRASYAAEAEEWAHVLVDQRGLKRIAIFYQDDSFGRAGRSGLVQALHKRGLALAAEGTYMRNTTAVKSALIDIRRAHPDAIVFVAAPKALARFVTTAQSLDFQPQMISISFGADSIAQELGQKGTGLLMTQVVPFPGDESLPVVAQYRAALTALDPAVKPSFINLEGYLVGRLAIEALRQTGRDLTRARYLATLRSMTEVELGGLKLTFSGSDNQGLDQVFLTRIDEAGRVVPVAGGF